jgi:hypothetical protein
MFILLDDDKILFDSGTFRVFSNCKLCVSTENYYIEIIKLKDGQVRLDFEILKGCLSINGWVLSRNILTLKNDYLDIYIDIY